MEPRHATSRTSGAPTDVFFSLQVDLGGGAGRQGALCGRRRLSVDFADIGWADWIISPRSFEAHYCAGACPFPITKVRIST